MITDLQDKICRGCKHNVYLYSPLSQDYDYYTCQIGRCPGKCYQGIYND